jgi:hypothetical protein
MFGAHEFFFTIEAFAFLLPALPNERWVRLVILTVYLIGHCFGLNKVYSQIKNKYTEHK